MKSIIITITVVLIMAMGIDGTGASQSGDRNLAVNGRLEGNGPIPDYWYCFKPSALVYDKTAGREGQACLFIDSPLQETTVSQRSLVLVPGERYKMSGYLRSKGFTGGKGGIVVYNTGWNNGSAEIPAPQGDAEWKYYEKEFIAPDSCDGIYTIGFFMVPGTGAIGVCDIRLEALSARAKKESRNLISDRALWRVIPLRPDFDAIPANQRQLWLGFPYLLPSEENRYECRIVLPEHKEELCSFRNLFGLLGKRAQVKSFPIREGIIAVNLDSLPEGTNKLTASIVHKPDEKTVCETRLPIRIVPAVEKDYQPGRFLNSLVAELTRETVELKPESVVEIKFDNPRDGWIFISAAPGSPGAGLQCGLSASKPPIDLNQKANSTAALEAMRRLPAGEYKLTVMAHEKTAVDVVIRAVPELMYYNAGSNPHIKAYGKYDWNFLERYILPSGNCFLSTVRDPADYERARMRGISWLYNCNVIHTNYNADEIVAALTNQPGFTNRWYAGVTLDEFCDESPLVISTYARVMEKMRKAAPGRLVYSYLRLTTTRAFAELVASIPPVGKMLCKIYCLSQPTQADARKYLEKNMFISLAQYRAFLPEAQRDMAMVLGCFDSINCLTLDHYPEIDYKYYMDMQLNIIANHPEFQGLYGLGYWGSPYANEETLRWAWRLIRHYAIEGRRDMLSDQYGFRYLPGHIQNGDFADGTNGWTFLPVEPDGMRADRFEKYGQLQARWYAPDGVGDTFLVMRRSAAGANRAVQAITNLVPGKLYSLQYVVASLDGLKAGKTPSADLGARESITGVDIIPEKSFLYVVDGFKGIGSANTVPPFNRNNQFCPNPTFADRWA